MTYTKMTYIATQHKHKHLLLSILMVGTFLVATALGSFVMMGVLSSTTHRSQGQIELPYSQSEVWGALLDVESRSQFEADWYLLQVSVHDQDGALLWDAETGYGKISQFERVATQKPSRVTFEEVSLARNSRILTEFRLESSGNSRTKVIATQTRETPRWFDRSLLVLHGLNHNLQHTFGYLKTYFASGF